MEKEVKDMLIRVLANQAVLYKKLAIMEKEVLLYFTPIDR